MNEERTIAREIADSLHIAHFIRNTYIEETDSPWNEKTLIKRKRDHIDVKMAVWKDNSFLYGRIYRLLLYVFDVLNPHFQYQPEIAPAEDKEPKLKNRHNQIWSIYVDSRVEKKGIENFYDRTVRRNIFIDAERELGWKEASLAFRRLWEKDSYTYPEITDYTYDLDKPTGETVSGTSDLFESEVTKFLCDPSALRHLDKINSTTFRSVVNELLNFTAYICKDTYIESSYFGISFFYQKRVILEMIPEATNIVFLTFLDASSNSYKTLIVTENSDITEIQKIIKEMYNKIAAFEHF